MKELNEEFTKALATHKKLIASMVRSESKSMILAVAKTGIELALVYADFRCESCKAYKNLQIHHLIPRYYKDFVDFWKYIPQRNYWANLIVLCNDCHNEVEKVIGNRKTPCIGDAKLDKIRKKFKVSKW